MKQSPLANTRILLGVTGSIATYKSADLCRQMIKAGAQVQVIMTRSATKFVAPLTFETLSGRRVVTDLGATRYDLAAQGFGCHAEHVTEPGDLPGALERAFASGKPACVNVMTDPSVIAPVTRSMIGAPRRESETPASGAAARKKDETIQIPYYENLKD